jgi:hypothetical protein
MRMRERGRETDLDSMDRTNGDSGDSHGAEDVTSDGEQAHDTGASDSRPVGDPDPECLDEEGCAMMVAMIAAEGE